MPEDNLHLSLNQRRAAVKTWSKGMLIEALLATQDQLASAQAELAVGCAQLRELGIERLTEPLYEQQIVPRTRLPELSVDEYLERYPDMAWLHFTRRPNGQVVHIRSLRTVLEYLPPA